MKKKKKKHGRARQMPAVGSIFQSREKGMRIRGKAGGEVWGVMGLVLPTPTGQVNAPVGAAAGWCWENCYWYSVNCRHSWLACSFQHEMPQADETLRRLT